MDQQQMTPNLFVYQCRKDDDFLEDMEPDLDVISASANLWISASSAMALPLSRRAL
jgi:hypothetical protein